MKQSLKRDKSTKFGRFLFDFLLKFAQDESVMNKAFKALNEKFSLKKAYRYCKGLLIMVQF